MVTKFIIVGAVCFVVGLFFGFFVSILAAAASLHDRGNDRY